MVYRDLQKKREPRRRTQPENTNTTEKQKTPDHLSTVHLVVVRGVDDLLLLLLLLAGVGNARRSRRRRRRGGDENVVVVLLTNRSVSGDGGLPNILTVPLEQEPPVGLLRAPFVALGDGDGPVGVTDVGVPSTPPPEVLLAIYFPVSEPGGTASALHKTVGLVQK